MVYRSLAVSILSPHTNLFCRTYIPPTPHNKATPLPYPLYLLCTYPLTPPRTPAGKSLPFLSLSVNTPSTFPSLFTFCCRGATDTIFKIYPLSIYPLIYLVSLLNHPPSPISLLCLYHFETTELGHSGKSYRGFLADSGLSACKVGGVSALLLRLLAVIETANRRGGSFYGCFLPLGVF